MQSTIDIVRHAVGRRRVIQASEMADILHSLVRSLGLDLANPYVRASEGDADSASQAWTSKCRGNIAVSLSVSGYLRDGQVRYDEPGSLDPHQHAELTFVPASMDRSSVRYLRAHADRVLRVHPAPEAPSSPLDTPPEKCECDNAHTWYSDDPQRDWQCPRCGEPWV